MKLCFVDLSTKLQTINDLKTQARGGMVSSLFKITDLLAGMGHEVFVASDVTEPGVTDAGVQWVKQIYPSQEFDVLVCNRGTYDGLPNINAKRRVLWTHDLPHSGFISEPKLMKGFAATVFMSRYAEQVWRTFYPTIGKSRLIPNGVDKGLFKPGLKNLDYMIYISAPNRGLKRLPLIVESVQEYFPSARMKAFSNLGKLHPNEIGETDEFEGTYKTIQESNIELCDPVPQTQLAGELGKAGMMVLPTNYPEICSNSILQSLACGTPVITTGNIGSAGEWVRSGWNGLMTRFHPCDYMVFQMEMTRNCVSLFKDRRKHEKLIRNAARTKIYSWEDISWKWHKMLKSL